MSFEAIFVLLLCTVLYIWLAIEEKLAATHLKASTSLWESSISFRKPFETTLLPSENSAPVTADCIRQVAMCLFFGILSFFGIGNIASINTFDPATVYCFLTVFSPFIMGSLILLKMVIPFVYVSCAYNCIVSLLEQSLKNGLLLVLIMTDVMALNFFFLVRDSGSWLEIGVSISHYVIAMVVCVGAVVLMGLARLLTGVSIVPRKEQLKCKCSPPLCGQSYCHTDYKCYKSASFNSNNQEEILFGCYHASVDVFGTCNGTLDTPTHKIRCCKDNDMCNEDLDVSLVPESDPPTPPVTTQLPSPPPGLICECSPSHCPNDQTWCHSNYSCFREIEFSDTTNTFEHTLGCIDTIEQAKLDKIGVCDGRFDTQTSALKCCSDRDMCNRDLPIETPSTDQGTTRPPSPAGDDGSLTKDNDLFIIMSVVVVLVMVVVTVLVVATVGMFCLHYQKEKTKVMSVDQFSPPTLKQLSNSSITCSITSSQHPLKDHTEINNYV
ncbi:GPI ethanolamine phosphate transferase 1 [Geodia barretti]|uniref:GPI ethanolamine phosphate transferase 1 n=1 Tax=Geodia barretti TaxID=519541 RepID=A0AA35XHZ6_GEOBA|nr:GPI ethanolamine phosphate transferase 1 [Geodia barretti]